MPIPLRPDFERQPGTDTANIEIWFGDQARVGQKNKITRR